MFPYICWTAVSDSESCDQPAEVSVALINSYANWKTDKHSAMTSFMLWALMTSTNLLGFGVARLIVGNLELMRINLKEFIGLILCEQTMPEVKLYYNVCNNLLSTPLPAQLKQWIFYHYSGMISDNYYPKLRLPNNPFTASISIGIYNGALEPNVEPITFISYPQAAYKINFFRWGYKLSHGGSSELPTGLSKKASQRVGNIQTYITPTADETAQEEEDEDLNRYFA